MRSALGREVRKRFGSEISRSFPGFAELKGHSIWPGDRLYVHRTPTVSFFIRLVPDFDRDQFRVMYGWSSSGEPPREQLQLQIEREKDLPRHDGYEFRIMQCFNDAGGMEDRWWVLEDATGVAFKRTLDEFAVPGDTPIQTLERATSEGLSYMLSIHRESAVEKLLPRIPPLIQDCIQHLRETVIPYFEKVRKTRADNAA